MEPNALKVAVVGDKGVGKTSLVRRFCGEDVLSDTLDLKKITKSHTQLPYPLAVSTPPIYAEFWDISEKYMQDNAQSMYKDAHYILLVYDITKYSTFKSITTKWYNEAISHSPNSVVLVLGTKVDLSTVNREVSIQEVEHFAAEHELFFMEVSAVDTTNIELTLKILRIRAGTMLPHLAPSHYEEESEEENGGGEIESTSYSPPQQHYNHTNGRSAPSLISSIMEDLHIDEEYTGNGHDYLDEDMMAEEYYGEQSPPAPAYLLKDFEERKGHLVPVIEENILLEDDEYDNQPYSPQFYHPTRTQTSKSAPPTYTKSPPTHHRSTSTCIEIDVQLTPHHSEKIIVRSGDNAHRIAAAFVQKHGLDSSCIRPLAYRIQQAVTEYRAHLVESSNGNTNANNTNRSKEATNNNKMRTTTPTASRPLSRGKPRTVSITEGSTKPPKRRELLTFIVDMGSGKKVPITVREGDSPIQLARSFVKAFQLRQSVADYIAEQINAQLQTLQTQEQQQQQSTTDINNNNSNNQQRYTSPTPTSPQLQQKVATKYRMPPKQQPKQQSPPLSPQLRPQQQKQQLLQQQQKNLLQLLQQPPPPSSQYYYQNNNDTTPSTNTAATSRVSSTTNKTTKQTNSTTTRPTSSPTARLKNNTVSTTATNPTTTTTNSSSKPMLFDLEVDLPGGSKGVIRVYDGAPPRKLAYDFAAKYHLPTTLVDVLEQLIYQQIQVHSTKKPYNTTKQDRFGGKIVKMENNR